MPSRHRLAVCSFLAILAAACGGGTVEEAAPITGIFRDAQVSWRPPEHPDPAARAGISAALRLDGPLGEHVGPVLLPGPVPAAAGIQGADSAELTVTRTIPTNIERADVVVRRSDLSVVVSLVSLASDDLPACANRLDGEWSPITVRGLPGCSLLVPGAVSFLRWEEAGGGFQTEFGPDVPVDGLLAWLDAWQPATG